MISHKEIKQRLAYELFKMLSRYHNIDSRYHETREFKRLFKVAIYEVLKNNVTKDVAPIIPQALKDTFLELFTRVGVHKQIRYALLPALWKDNMAIERKNKKKSNFFAEVFDEEGRHIEVHVVRVIVKPYIRDLNLNWRNMTALDKAKALYKLA